MERRKRNAAPGGEIEFDPRPRAARGQRREHRVRYLLTPQPTEQMPKAPQRPFSRKRPTAKQAFLVAAVRQARTAPLQYSPGPHRDADSYVGQEFCP